MFDANEMFQSIEEIVGKGIRRPGSPGDKATEEYIHDLFSQHLDQVSRQGIPISYWDVTEHAIVCNDGSQRIPSFYMPYTQFTPDEGIEGELIYVADKPLGQIQALPLRGKIVVFDLYFPMLRFPQLKRLSLAVHDSDRSMPTGDIHEATWIRPSWYVYEEAARQGAAGGIGTLRNQPGGLNSYYAPYGFREKDILDKPIPGFWVGKNDAAELVQKAEAGEKLRLVLKGIKEPVTTFNIIGQIQGKTDETIIIASHHDAPFDNAVEDGSGLAVLLALAKQLAQEKAKLKRSIVFMATAGHFYGSIGTRQYIERNRDFLDANVVAEIHIEHIAKEVIERDGKLVLSGRTEPAAIFTNFNRTAVKLITKILAEEKLARTMVLPAHGPLGNYPPTDGGDFYEAGVPIFNYISNPLYLLCNADTLEMVDKDRLVPVANAFYKLAHALQDVPKEELRKVHYPAKRFIAWLATTVATRESINAATG